MYAIYAQGMPVTCGECKSMRPNLRPDTCVHPDGECPWERLYRQSPFLFMRASFAIQVVDRHEHQDPRTKEITKTEFSMSIEKFNHFARILRIPEKHLERAWRFCGEFVEAAKDAPDLVWLRNAEKRKRAKRIAEWKRTRSKADDASIG